MALRGLVGRKGGVGGLLLSRLAAARFASPANATNPPVSSCSPSPRADGGGGAISTRLLGVGRRSFFTSAGGGHDFQEQSAEELAEAIRSSWRQRSRWQGIYLNVHCVLYAMFFALLVAYAKIKWESFRGKAALTKQITASKEENQLLKEQLARARPS